MGVIGSSYWRCSYGCVWVGVRGNYFSLFKIGYRVWVMDALLAEVILDDIAKSIVVEVQGEKSMA